MLRLHQHFNQKNPMKWSFISVSKGMNHTKKARDKIKIPKDWLEQIDFAETQKNSIILSYFSELWKISYIVVLFSYIVWSHFVAILPLCLKFATTQLYYYRNMSKHSYGNSADNLHTDGRNISKRARRFEICTRKFIVSW